MGTRLWVPVPSGPFERRSSFVLAERKGQPGRRGDD